MVLCRAAELARERIARLVFVDALALLDGECIGQIVNRTGTRITTALAVGPSREDAESRTFAHLDPALRAWALARYTPHPIAAMEDLVELKSFWSQTWSATVIRCRRSANPPEAHQRRTAEKLTANTSSSTQATTRCCRSRRAGAAAAGLTKHKYSSLRWPWRAGSGT
jgi:hypothetical protein